jgi:low temperature requirement protein LtrA
VYEDWKLKIALLWLIKEATIIVSMVLSLYDPNVSEQIIAGKLGEMQTTPELLLVFTIILLVPLVMSFLSVTLKDSASRWTNIIVGIIFTVIELTGITDVLANPSAYVMVMFVALVVVPALIVWYAWKSKQ